MKPVRIGICGLGTVATGVVDLIRTNAETIARRLGTTVNIKLIGARRDNPDCDVSEFPLTRDIFDVATSHDVDIVIELIGGVDVAKDLVLKAMEAGKHVVTANKALIAEYGNMLTAAAEKHGVMLNFEAAVAGGIPVLETLKEALSGNDVDEVIGIINGTSNYILSAMTRDNVDFNKALADAKDKGYAEADPTFDIEGLDAAHKIVIMASMAFGIPIDFDKVYCEGITGIEREDISYARELGYTIKHIGVAKKIGTGNETRYEVRVHPALLPQDELLAQVHGVTNAVEIHAKPVGSLLFTGPGAGGGATASSVVADVINIARTGVLEKSFRTPTLGFQQHMLEQKDIVPSSDVHCAWYLRILVRDKFGVMAQVATIFSNEHISLEGIMQKEPAQTNTSLSDHVSMVLLTHSVEEHKISRAQTHLENLEAVQGSIQKIRLIPAK